MMSHSIYDIIYDICSFAGADIPPAQRVDAIDDGERNPDRDMDYDEERDFAERHEHGRRRSDSMKDISSCMSTVDIQQLLQDIPVQPPVAVPVRTVQEAVAAGDLPSVDVEAGNVFSQSEHILHTNLQEHVLKHDTNATALKDLIQRVLHHPDFNADEVDHDYVARYARASGEGRQGWRHRSPRHVGGRG